MTWLLHLVLALAGRQHLKCRSGVLGGHLIVHDAVREIPDEMTFVRPGHRRRDSQIAVVYPLSWAAPARALHRPDRERD